jgi:hypothetical protein
MSFSASCLFRQGWRCRPEELNAFSVESPGATGKHLFESQRPDFAKRKDGGHPRRRFNGQPACVRLVVDPGHKFSL